ncbi:MAG: hypothetical protein QXK12_04255 [Candidatus Nezhaarchaeales archaeon]
MVKQQPPPAKVKEVKEEVTLKPEVKGFRIIHGELSEGLQEGFGAMRAIFTEYWKEFRDYRQEFRNYREEFRDFARRTNDNFKLLFDKYGEILEKLL